MKNVAMLFSIIWGSLFILTSCGMDPLGDESAYGEQVNGLEGVTIELTEDKYQPEGDTFELRVVNHSDEQITYGVEYALEYYNEDKWYEVETDEEISFIMIAHILESDEEATEEINLTYYEPLTPGRYRVIRQINDEPMAAEFEVAEEN